MEALLFMLDSLVVVVMVFMGLRDDRRLPGAPARSWFRMVEDDAGVSPAIHPEQPHERSWPGEPGF